MRSKEKHEANRHPVDIALVQILANAEDKKLFLRIKFVTDVKQRRADAEGADQLTESHKQNVITASVHHVGNSQFVFFFVFFLYCI